MTLPELCVKRPVFSVMLIGFLLVLGIFSFRDLGVDLFPKADPASNEPAMPFDAAARAVRGAVAKVLVPGYTVRFIGIAKILDETTGRMNPTESPKGNTVGFNLRKTDPTGEVQPRTGLTGSDCHFHRSYLAIRLSPGGA